MLSSSEEDDDDFLFFFRGPVCCCCCCPPLYTFHPLCFLLPIEGKVFLSLGATQPKNNTQETTTREAKGVPIAARLRQDCLSPELVLLGRKRSIKCNRYTLVSPASLMTCIRGDVGYCEASFINEAPHLDNSVGGGGNHERNLVSNAEKKNKNIKHKSGRD